MRQGNSARYESPWQRLHWTVPTALVLWSASWWAISAYLFRAPPLVEQLPSITARIVELPPPPVIRPPEPEAEKSPAPAVQKPQRKSATPARNNSRSKPSAEPASAANPVHDLASLLPADVNQHGEKLALDATPRFPRHVGVARRSGAQGVINRPLFLSVDNEENPPDPDKPGQGLGGWMQDGAEPCDYEDYRNHDYNTWVRLCGHIPQFSQPPAPWCFDDIPIAGIRGSCDDEMRRALADYRRKNFAPAFQRFKKLAEKEYAPAQFNLGKMYAEGEGVERDDVQAFNWYRKAAAEGDAKAIFNLALMYSDGRGVARDDAKAAFWYTKAAYYGYAEAQFNLALAYAEGTGVKQDDKQAAYWYRKAADRGNPVAQYNLGIHYAEGIGVPQDDKQAMYWYCKAAIRGDEKAMASLALLYPGGSGNASTDELAYFCWLTSNSKRINYENAEDGRLQHEKKLTIAQRDGVRAAFQIWKAKPIKR